MKLFKNISLTLVILLFAFANAHASDDEGVEELAPVTSTLPENGKVLGTQTNDLLPLILSKTTTDEDGRVIPILSIQDLGRCAVVCKTWKAISELNKVWEPLANSHFNLQKVTIETYESGSPIFTALFVLPNPYKWLLSQKVQIQYELAAVAKDLFVNKKNPSVEMMVALELMGDTSLISTYLSEKRNELLIEKKTELISILDECIKLGSQSAASFKVENKI